MENISSINQVHFSNIPTELQSHKQWVAWKPGDVGNIGKITKIPINPATGLNASTKNPDTWASYQDACDYYAANMNNGIAGIGFVFTSEDTYCGVDLDNCRDPETGELQEWAADILHDLNSYCEVSPSLTGVKVFLKGYLPDRGRNFGDIEMYDTGRYFTVTGQTFNGFPGTVEDRTEAVIDLYNRLDADLSIPAIPVYTASGLVINDVENLAVGYGTKKLIKEGEPVGKRSNAIMSVLGSLVNAGVPDQDIISIFEDYPIGEKYLEKGHNREQWLQPQIDKARKFINADSDATEASLKFPYHIMSGAAGTFADIYGSHLETPREFLYMSYLTCLGNILAGRLTISSILNPQPRLYTLLLGQSADDRKSTALKMATNHFKECADDFHICWGVGSAEGLQKRLEDTTEGLLLCFDEFNQFLSKCNITASVLLPCVNTLFESNNYESRTKTTKIDLQDAYLSMIAASTVQTYERTWNPAFTDIGFTNRIFLVPGTAKRMHSLPPKISDQDKLFMLEKLHEVLTHVGSGKEMELTETAKALFQNWYMNAERSIHAKRLDTYATRLMGLLAVNDLKDDIDEETVTCAIKLCDWQLQVRKIHDPIDADNKIAALEERIRRALRKGQKKIGQLKQSVNANRTGIWFFEKALNNLERYEEISLNNKSKKWKLLS